MQIGQLIKQLHRALVTYSIFYIAVAIQLYGCLLQQLQLSNESESRCESSKREPNHHDNKLVSRIRSGPWKKLASIKPAIDFLYKFQIIVYMLYIVHRALINLLSFDVFADYHYLDCFILGRFRYIGRANKISFAVLVCLFNLATFYHYVLHNILLPLKFYAINFLLYDYEEVLAYEVKFHSSLASEAVEDRKPDAYHRACHQDQTTNGVRSMKRRWNTSRLHPLTSELDLYSCSPESDDNYRPNLTFCFKNPFFLDGEIGTHSVKYDKWILRPNRTSHSWMILSWSAVLALLSLPGVVYSAYTLLSDLIGGAIWSSMGFELSYPTCAAWVQRNQQQYFNNTGTAPLIDSDHNIPYSSIYIAPRVLASQIHMDDIPANIPMDTNSTQQLNWYGWTRISTDIVVNIYWYISYMVDLSATNNLTFLCTIDVIINANEIRRRLEKLIGTLRQLKLKTSEAKLDKLELESQEHSARSREELADLSQLALVARGDEFIKAGGHSENESYLTQLRLRAEITNIQALLVDHFSMVQGYNIYYGFASFLFFLHCAMNSFVMIVWISTIDSRAVEREFMMTEITLTIFAVVNFSFSAIVRTINYRLYERIAAAMALDQHVDTKMRWPTIMGYYAPKSMYCFTLFSSSEVSWLFSLKFVSWYYSVLLVLANFYYMRVR